nr:RusA family crossover junction endodeoxyribonuclease [uncultured Olsenella sp.]
MAIERMRLQVPEVVGKARPRVTTRNGRAMAYTPAKTRRFEALVSRAWREQATEDRSGFRGPVVVTVEVWRELARTNPKCWRDRPDLGKPDLDNVAKAVLDALNGVAYADDSQVVSFVAIKHPRLPYGDGCWVSVEIHYVEEEK